MGVEDSEREEADKIARAKERERERPPKKKEEGGNSLSVNIGGFPSSPLPLLNGQGKHARKILETELLLLPVCACVPVCATLESFFFRQAGRERGTKNWPNMRQCEKQEGERPDESVAAAAQASTHSSNYFPAVPAERRRLVGN